MAEPLSILVTGDVVNDVHLYIDTPAAQGAAVVRRSVVHPRAGGAALTRDLLVAAAQAAGWKDAAIDLGLADIDDTKA